MVGLFPTRLTGLFLAAALVSVLGLGASPQGPLWDFFRLGSLLTAKALYAQSPEGVSGETSPKDPVPPAAYASPASPGDPSSPLISPVVRLPLLNDPEAAEDNGTLIIDLDLKGLTPAETSPPPSQGAGSPSSSPPSSLPSSPSSPSPSQGAGSPSPSPSQGAGSPSPFAPSPIIPYDAISPSLLGPPLFGEELQKRVISLKKEAGELLMEVSYLDVPDAYPYLANVEKALVLYFQVQNLTSEDPEIYQTLGRLMEIRALLAEDRDIRRELMEEAQTQFARSARLDFDKDFERLGGGSEGTSLPPLADPYLSDLVFAGRLRRGEVDINELMRRHGDGFLPPGFNPGFWEERFFLMQKGDSKEEREELLNIASKDFDLVWNAMPMELPWKNPSDRFGTRKIKKIEVSEAYAITLLNLSLSETDPRLSKILFDKALEVLQRALTLALDEHEMGVYYSKLTGATHMVPDHESLTALYALKDKYFQKLSTLPKRPKDTLALWGDDLYARADLEADDALWNQYLSLAHKKYEEYLKESEDQGKAYFREGETLELKTSQMSSYLLSLSKDDLLNRKRKALTLAIDSYQKAREKDPDGVLYLKAIARASLKLGTLAKDENEFQKYFGDATKLSLIAASRDPDLGGAYLAWGRELLLSPAPALAGAGERMGAEALASFRQYLRSNSPFVSELAEMANLVYATSQKTPALSASSLSLLSEILKRMIALKPNEPSYRFGLALTILLSYDAEGLWPDDAALTSSDYAKSSFLELLRECGEGLELLSLGYSLKKIERDWDQTKEPTLSGPLNNFRKEPEYLDFLEPEGFMRFQRAKSSQSERVAQSFNIFMVRFLSLAEPDALPPWYKLQLASLLRRAAASGYLPPEEEMAYFRMSLVLLNKARDNLSSRPEDDNILPFILSEKGLVLSEISLIAKKDKDLLLKQSALAFEEAEGLLKGSSGYSRARWAAWQNDEEPLKKLLSHAALDEDRFLWPPFDIALQEPAFRRHKDKDWFKTSWFGYLR
jgi:hypothetical protein